MVLFVHAADLHLDSPYKGIKDLSSRLGEKIKESTFQSLTAIVDLAVDQQVDFVLFSGDIYDLEDRSIKAQIVFKEEMQRLNDQGIPVCLIHGNHDFLGNEADHLSLPSNVTVFPSEVETIYIQTKKGERVAVSGFSYDRKWIDRRMIIDYPSRKAQIDYHIGLLHGYEEGQKSEHGRYAPFSLAELAEKNYDYWALGHIHNRQQLSAEPLVYYSGNTQGRHRKETGDKGCLLVNLSRSGHSVDFKATAPIIWKELNVDVSTLETLDSIYEKIRQAVIETSDGQTLLYLKVIVSSQLSDKIMTKLNQDDFIETLHHDSDKSFAFVTGLKIQISNVTANQVSLEQLFTEEWKRSVEYYSENEAFNEVTKELLNTHPFSVELSEQTEEYRREILESALTLLQYDLGMNEG